MREYLTMEEAISVFDQCADMSDISFGYTHDGCYARAHIMCQRLKKADIETGKAWAIESGDRFNMFKVNHYDGTTTRWGWHVASTINVKQHNGNIVKMIIDPSLFDGPVTKKEWADIMNADQSNIHFTKLGEPAPGKSGDYTTSSSTDENTDDAAFRRMYQCMGMQDKHQRVVFKSQIRQEYIQSQTAQSGQCQTEGTTWLTEYGTSLRKKGALSAFLNRLFGRQHKLKEAERKLLRIEDSQSISNMEAFQIGIPLMQTAKQGVYHALSI